LPAGAAVGWPVWCLPSTMSSDKTGRTLPRRRSAGREDFLRALLLLPLALPFGAMMHRLHERSRPAPQPLPADLPMGLSIAGDAIVFRHDDGRVQAWSARCTHLGCRLDRVIDGAVVCPCHGSRFDEQGRVLNGPAARPLQPLPVQAEASGGWTVRLRA
jgi:nitrite reductase/ring-hydroxylating ferredoxin subunit